MNRDLYGRLLGWKAKPGRKPLVLGGARQTGKTWLLKSFGSREFRRVHYVNLENAGRFRSLFVRGLAPKDVLPQLAVLLGADIEAGHDLLVLDEIQQSPEALTALKYFHEELPAMAVAAAGSHIGLHVQESSFPVGQVDMLTLYPLSFAEFLDALDHRLAAFARAFDPASPLSEAVHAELWRALTLYFVVGGMPEAAQAYLDARATPAEAFARVREVQTTLCRGYAADFAKHAGKVNATHLARVFESVPVQLARTVDGGLSRYRFKDVLPGRSKYVQFAGPIDWLVRAGLVLRVSLIERPEIPLKTFARDNMFKLYLFDVGLLGCMAGLTAAEVLGQDFGTYKGWFAENFVAQEFATAGLAPLYFWQGRQSEIEFVLAGADSVVPVEVKSGRATHSRSLAAFMEKYAPRQTARLSAKGPRRQDSGVCDDWPLYFADRVPGLLGGRGGSRH